MLLLLPIVLDILSIRSTTADLSSSSTSVEFECSRIPTTYCCTSRVRISCSERCFTVRCEPDFYEQVLANTAPSVLVYSATHSSLTKSEILNITTEPALPDDSSLVTETRRNSGTEPVIGQRTFYKNGVNDGDTAEFRSGLQTVRITLPPFERRTLVTLINIYPTTTTPITATATTTTTTTASTITTTTTTATNTAATAEFPELPSHAVLPSAFIFSFTSTTSAEESSPKPLSRDRSNEKSLPAPTSNDGKQSLINLASSEDYEATEATGELVPPIAVPIPQAPPPPPPPPAPLLPSQPPLPPSPPRNVTATSTFKPLEPFVVVRRPPPRASLPGQEENGPDTSRWKIRSLKVVRHVTPAPNWSYNRHLIDSESGLGPQWNLGLEKGINALLGAYFATRTPTTRRWKVSFPESRFPYTTSTPYFPPGNAARSFNIFGMTNMPPSSPAPVPLYWSNNNNINNSITTKRQFLWTATQIPSVITNSVTAQCGVAPDFSPCISIAQANYRFSQCCRSKLLPLGCQNLCKYDVTETEIKAALDAGLCGILHVAPIVECASDGRDNSECCAYKHVVAKSGPQCEIFCHPEREIKGLGLQHLVCRKVMKELIACHLSGLRP